MNKKRTAIIQILTSPESGGAELIGKQLAEGILDNKFDSYVIYFSNHKKVRLSNKEIVLGSFNPRDLRNFFLLRNRIKLLKKKYNKLIIHAHLTWPLFFTSLIKSSSSIKKIYTEHNTYNKRRNIYFLRYLERIVYKQYDYITFISKGTKSNLEKWLGIKLNIKSSKVIYNGARNFKYSFSNKKNNDKLNIISIGSLTYQKGFDIGIKSISICREIVNEYRIYGEGPERNKLEKLINKLKLNNIVKIYGFNNKLNEINLNCNLALMPSRWEGFGLVSIELLSAGIPIIANSVEGLNEVISNCEAAFLLNNLNYELLSKEIYKYNLGFRFATGLDKKAILYSKKFSLEKMIKQYHEIYNLL